MLVVHDGVDLPSMRWVGAALAMVITGLGQVPQVIDHAGADEGVAQWIESDAPGIASPLAEQTELLGARIDAKHGARKLVGALRSFYARWIKDAVEAIQESIGAPGEIVGQLVGVEAAKASGNDCLLVSFVVSVGVFEK